MAANPDMAFTPDWLCGQLYATSRVEKKHRVSVLRAIHRITDVDLDWAIYYGNGRLYNRHQRYVLFNRADLQSHQMAALMGRNCPKVARAPGAMRDVDTSSHQRPSHALDSSLGYCALAPLPHSHASSLIANRIATTMMVDTPMEQSGS
jgi:hypothetical protein